MRQANYSATIEGQPPDASVGVRSYHLVGPAINLANVSFRLPGGGEAADRALVPPHASTSYPPRDLGIRPAYGMFMRHAHGVSISDTAFRLEAPDSRPVFVLSDVYDVAFDNVIASRGRDLAYDVEERHGCHNVSTGSLVPGGDRSRTARVQADTATG